MDIFVGVTCRDGLNHFDLTTALAEEQRLASKRGDRLLISGISGIPYIDRARNVVADLFLNTTAASCMVWLDYDISWVPGDLVRLAKRPEEFVGGAYRLKQATESYPVAYWPEQAPIRNAKGSIECRHVPFGFTKVARSVYDRFKAHTPNRTYTDRIRGTVHMYFQSLYIPGDDGEPGHKIEEDIGFALEWGAMDGKIYVDPSIPLIHHFGMVPFPGDYGKWLDAQVELARLKEHMNDPSNGSERRPGPFGGPAIDSARGAIGNGFQAMGGAPQGRGARSRQRA